MHLAPGLHNASTEEKKKKPKAYNRLLQRDVEPYKTSSLQQTWNLFEKSTRGVLAAWAD